MKKTLLIGCLIFSTGSYAGLDSWISSILPKSMRASEEYRREIDHMKRQTGNTVPVICINANLQGKALGSAESIGFPFFHFAILRFDEDAMQYHSKEGYTAYNTSMLAHELTHAAENHGGKLQVWMRLTQLAISIAVGGFTKIAIDTYNDAPTDQRVNTIAVAASIIGYYALNKTAHLADESLRNELYKEYEYQAEKGASETLQKLGYCKAIENLYKQHKSEQDMLPDDKKQDLRLYGENHASVGQYVDLWEKAMNECRHDIDPRTTQDTPNLMRNGSPLNQPNT